MPPITARPKAALPLANRLLFILNYPCGTMVKSSVPARLYSEFFILSLRGNGRYLQQAVCYIGRAGSATPLFLPPCQVRL